MSKNNDMDMYQQMMAWENESRINHSGLPAYTGTGQLDNPHDDMEVMFTSKEIVKEQVVLTKDGKIQTFSDGKIEEQMTFKRMTTKRVHKYTEQELEVIRESCLTTYVHDYGKNDIYHMSDEERAENDMLAAVATKLATVRATYTRVDQYVVAMRIVHEAWSVLAEQNVLHTRKEFFELVSEGIIESNRIVIPKLRYMNRYDKEMLAVYISNPHLDPSDLIHKEPINYDDLFEGEEGYESDEDRMIRILGKSEVEYILNSMDDPELHDSIVVKPIRPKDYKDYEQYDRTGRLPRYDRKPKFKGSKSDKFIHECTSKLLLQVQKNEGKRNNQGYGAYSYHVASSMFEQETDVSSIWDELYFDGSWGNDNDVKLYELAVEEAKRGQYAGQYRTAGDIEIENILKTMEEDGLSVLDIRRRLSMTSEDTAGAFSKARTKENKRQEAIILDRLQKLNNSKKFKKIISKVEDQLEESIRDDYLYNG